MENYYMNNQNFICFIQNGKICNYSGQQVGVTTEEYNKAIDTAKGFQQKLIEAGILIKPKTPEEINQELQETLKQTQTMMLEMSNTIISLNEKVDKLEEKKDVKQANNSENGRAISTTRKDADVKSTDMTNNPREALAKAGVTKSDIDKAKNLINNPIASFILGDKRQSVIDGLNRAESLFEDNSLIEQTPVNELEQLQQSLKMLK